jgi:hypothetical protein
MESRRRAQNLPTELPIWRFQVTSGRQRIIRLKNQENLADCPRR